MILVHAIAEYNHGPKHLSVALPLAYPLPHASVIPLMSEVRRLCNLPDNTIIVIANIMPLAAP